MKNLCKSILIIGIFLSFISCDKITSDMKVDIYLIKSFETKQNSSEIIENSVILEVSPIIEYSDILNYNSKDHIFTISSEVADALLNIYSSLKNQFAVVIDSEIVYTGYFVSHSSSHIIDWTVITANFFGGDEIIIGFDYNEIIVDLGYPSNLEDWKTPDKRNDRRLINIFKRDGKLNE